MRQQVQRFDVVTPRALHHIADDSVAIAPAESHSQLQAIGMKYILS